MACLSLFSFNGLSCLSFSGYFSWQSFWALNYCLIENPPCPLCECCSCFLSSPLLFDQYLPFSYDPCSVDFLSVLSSFTHLIVKVVAVPDPISWIHCKWYCDISLGFVTFFVVVCFICCNCFVSPPCNIWWNLSY